ncbi:MAG: zinc ABC transporter substrate-binding protein [Chloroflexi bacterium]|nr:MAG: zinc ABC transporter substrate-binding protein [Chloroflexota bacterium]
MIRLPRAAVWLCCLLAVAACSRPNTGGAPPSGGSAPVRVVATTTVFADFVKSVGGDRVDVVSLVPKGGDVHTFDPRPTDITAVADAQLVVANGLGLDEWLTKLAADSGTKARIINLADSVPKDQYIVEDGIPNPHLWLDPDDAALYATTIRDALKALDPADGAVFDANTTAYRAKLAELKKWGQELVATVPADQRQLIAFHDALPYFARTYGFKIAGVILRAPGQDPSASDIAALVKAIRDNHIHVVVSEVQFSDKLAKTIADETGATIVSDLYDDSLGDAPVDSYDALVRYDIQQLVNAMKGGG